eukprot:762730_1
MLALLSFFIALFLRSLRSEIITNPGTTIVDCIGGEDCTINCNAKDTCFNSSINCPPGYKCLFSCGTSKSACQQSTINATDSIRLEINDCATGNQSTCSGMTVHVPPNLDGTPRAFLNVGGNFNGGQAPMHFYAIYGWNDIDITGYAGTFANSHAGTMHCTTDYSKTCAFNTNPNAWSCAASGDITCDNPPTHQSTTAAPTTSVPTVTPTASTNNPTFNPTIEPTLEPITLTLGLTQVLSTDHVQGIEGAGSESTPPGLSGGAIAGIVCGCVVLLAVAAYFGYKYYDETAAKRLEEHFGVQSFKNVITATKTDEQRQTGEEGHVEKVKNPANLTNSKKEPQLPIPEIPEDGANTHEDHAPPPPISAHPDHMRARTSPHPVGRARSNTQPAVVNAGRRAMYDRWSNMFRDGQIGGSGALNAECQLTSPRRAQSHAFPSDIDTNFVVGSPKAQHVQNPVQRHRHYSVEQQHAQHVQNPAQRHRHYSVEQQHAHHHGMMQMQHQHQAMQQQRHRHYSMQQQHHHHHAMQQKHHHAMMQQQQHHPHAMQQHPQQHHHAMHQHPQQHPPQQHPQHHHHAMQQHHHAQQGMPLAAHHDHESESPHEESHSHDISNDDSDSGSHHTEFDTKQTVFQTMPRMQTEWLEHDIAMHHDPDHPQMQSGASLDHGCEWSDSHHTYTRFDTQQSVFKTMPRMDTELLAHDIDLHHAQNTGMNSLEVIKDVSAQQMEHHEEEKQHYLPKDQSTPGQPNVNEQQSGQQQPYAVQLRIPQAQGTNDAPPQSGYTDNANAQQQFGLQVAQNIPAAPQEHGRIDTVLSDLTDVTDVNLEYGRNISYKD